MVRHKTIETALIIFAIVLVVSAAILVKNPTMIGYVTSVEYDEYTNRIELEDNSNIILVDIGSYSETIESDYGLSKKKLF